MEFYGFDDKKAEEAIEKYRERFSTIGLYENEIYEGIPQMLKKLCEAGCHLAVASSKPTVFVEKILDYFHIGQYFEVVVGSELDGRRTDKQEVIKEALKRLGVTKENQNKCAMVGDRKFDIIGARDESVYAIGVAYGYAMQGELEKEHPDFIADDVTILTDYLLENKKKSGFFTPIYPRIKKEPPKELSSFMRAFHIISPILIYYIMNTIIIFLAVYIIQWIFERTKTPDFAAFFTNYSHVLTNVIKFGAIIIATVTLIPSFLKEQPYFFHHKMKAISIINVVSLAIFSALFINVLFNLLHFTGSSKTFTDIANTQFTLPIFWGIILYGLISPIAEEVVFRGLVYNRLRRYFPLWFAVTFSSFLFGIYHGNIVQAIYGFILGFLITWVYEKYGSFFMPILYHSFANITVYVVMSNDVMKNTILTPIFCVLMGVGTVVCVLLICRQKENNN